MNSISASASERLRRSWWLTQLGLGILVGGLAFVWSARGLDWLSVFRVLRSAQYVWVFVAVLCVFGVALTKGARWGALYVTSEPRTAFADLFSALMITQMVNVLIPIRIGELIRIGLMKQSGQPVAATLATIAIEKTIDLVAAGLMAVAVVVLAVAPDWLQNWAFSILVSGLILIAGLVLIWYLRDWIESILTRVVKLGGWLPGEWQMRLLRVVHTLLQSLGALTSWSALTRVLMWTILAWTLSLLMMLALFAAFGLALHLSTAVVLVLSTILSNIVPSPPALVGIMQAIAVVVLGGYGISQPIALGFGIVLNVITVMPLILLGSWGLERRMASLIELLRGGLLRNLQKR